MAPKLARGGGDADIRASTSANRMRGRVVLLQVRESTWSNSVHVAWFKVDRLWKRIGCFLIECLDGIFAK